MDYSQVRPIAPLKKRLPRMKLCYKVQDYFIQTYKINPYPSKYDLTNMATKANVEVIRVQNWFKNHRRKDWLSGVLCRRCRFFRSPLDEQQHVKAPYPRPCLGYFATQKESVVDQRPPSPSIMNGDSISFISPQALAPVTGPGAGPGHFTLTPPPTCHYQPQMTINRYHELPCEVSPNQGPYYAHHYGHVYASHFGGREGYSDDSSGHHPIGPLSSMGQNWSFNAGTLLSCAPEAQWQWQRQPTAILQQTSELRHSEAYPEPTNIIGSQLAQQGFN